MIRIVLLLFVLLAGPALAQDQTTMNRQAEDDFKKADTALNQTYKKVIAALNGPTKSKLVTAQFLWIKFRDAEAKAYASQAEGGTMYPLLYFGSMSSSTRARTQQLKNWLIGN
ncbi:MAG: DUF1311 domain-containing protein [Armatimonadetes bacterium]|nr:DUF1311 domain-containing protein [Armatimonadota bacterium]